MKKMKKLLRYIPLTKPIYQQIEKDEYRHRFANDCYGCFWGVYQTFEEAIQSAPKNKKIGYNYENLAQDYQQMLESGDWEKSGRTIATFDYPVMFWLKSIFQQEGSRTVFDFGGNVGVHFYLYSKYIDYPENLHWTVCEVPAIAEAGKALAEKNCVKNINFTTKLEELNGQEVFISSGAIQYVKNLAEALAPFQKPKHLLINRLPLYENGSQFVTLQNAGRVFHVQYVFNKTEFLEELNKIGYELIDTWKDYEDNCYIPYYPEKSVSFYYGLYLKLRS
jgi:putative methyltransferase (TIGR04325 family)